MPTQTDDWTREDLLKVHESYMQGKTLRELGENHGISHERIRQRFVDEGLPTIRPKGQTLRRYANEVSAWGQKEEIWKLYAEHGTVEGVVAATGLPRPHVARIINEMPLRQIHRRKEVPRTSIKRDDIKKALKEAAKVCGEPLTIPNYRKVAPAHKWPADLTVVRAYGTWAKACKAAGVKANPPRGPRKDSYTADACIIAVRVCATELGRVPSYEQYVQWARANRMPSGASVRAKVGPWREALTQAFG